MGVGRGLILGVDCPGSCVYASVCFYTISTPIHRLTARLSVLHTSKHTHTPGQKGINQVMYPCRCQIHGAN